MILPHGEPLPDGSLCTCSPIDRSGGEQKSPFVDISPSHSGPPETQARLQMQLDELDLALTHQSGMRPALEQILAAAIAMERQRLAHTLQDTVVQSLTAVYFTTKVIKTNLRRSGSEVPEGVVLLGRLIEQTTAELHEAIKELQPSDGGPP